MSDIPDYENPDRMAALDAAASLPPEGQEPLSPLEDGSTLVPLAHAVLKDIMLFSDAKERRAAADSILDRFGQPRRKEDLGSARNTLVLNFPPDQAAKALGGLLKVFNKELPSATQDAIPVTPLAVKSSPSVHREGSS